MGKAQFFLTLGLLLLMLPVGPQAQPAAAAPDFVLPSLKDGNQRLSEYRGRVVLLTFWAGWCGDCVEQLPRLAELHRRFADQGVELVSVNIDRHSHQARDLARQLDFPVLFDQQQQIARLYDLRQLPVTLLIDPHGSARYSQSGSRHRDLDVLTSELVALLEEYR